MPQPTRTSTLLQRNDITPSERDTSDLWNLIRRLCRKVSLPMPDREFKLFGAGEGRRHEARGSVMFFKATADSTGGRFSLMERMLPPGGRMPPAHRHLNNDEGYFVLDGRVTLIVAGAEHVVDREAFALVPGGMAHTFGNTSSDPARVLVLHSPALDGYFAELESLWSRPTPPSVEEEQALMGRHGMRLA
jgi:mannose-6-phosphate isomerase-like protein (cupin superfamily)